MKHPFCTNSRRWLVYSEPKSCPYKQTGNDLCKEEGCGYYEEREATRGLRRKLRALGIDPGTGGRRTMAGKQKKKLRIRRPKKVSRKVPPNTIRVARVVTPDWKTVALLPKNPTIHFHIGEPLGKRKKFASNCIEVSLSPDKKGLQIRSLEGRLVVRPNVSNSIEVHVERM